MKTRLRILALEPYYGGSHRAVLDGLVERIDADWTVLTLPARKWKWRMRGAAITMAEQVRGGDFDLVFASTFVNLAEFRGLVGEPVASVPAIVYFHENQLVYPNRHSADWDYQFPLTNITSALSAECCAFNSRWNLEEFISAIPAFLREFPDHRPQGIPDAIAQKSVVLAPPFDPAAFDDVLGPGGVASAPRGERCRIVWPHRWEHDKYPGRFFSAVEVLAGEGLDFEVVVAGQPFAETRGIMNTAASALGERLIHCGEPASRAEYARLLASSDVVVSTAINEFFGIAMVEACYAGCAPVVPDALAYPDLYSAEQRYGSLDGLIARLRSHITDRPKPGTARRMAERYTFDNLTTDYERLFEQVARG